MSTITLTFGDRAENHKGMQILGDSASKGFDLGDLENFQRFFELLDCRCQMIDLDRGAYLLVVRNAPFDMEALIKEQSLLKPDRKAYMYGQVRNKHARWNLCFSDVAQEADYEKGKGTVVAFDKVPKLQYMREILQNLTETRLQCEGNYYYDVKKCGIGFHGDTERKIVIGLRLGKELPLRYHWWYDGKPFGESIDVTLGHGDMYFMSDKAVGWDWKRKKIPTLRHAAGCEKYIRVPN